MEEQVFKSKSVLHKPGRDFSKGFFKDFQRGFNVTIKTAFRKPVTLMYPFEVDQIEPRFRGIHALVKDNCIACGICARACPNSSIMVTTAKNEEGKKVLTDFHINLGRCIFCGLCQDACPKKALRLSTKYSHCCTTREELILKLDQLEANCEYIKDSR